MSIRQYQIDGMGWAVEADFDGPQTATAIVAVDQGRVVRPLRIRVDAVVPCIAYLTAGADGRRFGPTFRTCCSTSLDKPLDWLPAVRIGWGLGLTCDAVGPWRVWLWLTDQADAVRPPVMSSCSCGG